MELKVRLIDRLVGCSRQGIEEELEPWLGSSGEIVGGGAASDGRWANIDLNVDDRAIADVGLRDIVNELRGVLRSAGAPASTTITAFVSDEVTEEFKLG